jgi:hypothetical protein
LACGYLTDGHITKNLPKRGNNNFIFAGREKRKFNTEISDLLVHLVLQQKHLLVENNTSRVSAQLIFLIVFKIFIS